MGDAARLLAEVLDLPVDERARLARALLESLDGADADADELWPREIRRRVDEIEAGSATLDDESAVNERVRAKLERR